MSLNNLSATNSTGALFDAGDFAQNKRIVSNNQILYYTDPTSGIKCGYIWKGVLPHITSTNNPSTDGGISDNTWVPIIYSGLKEKLGAEGITLNWSAHLPTVEVAYGLNKNSLKIWTPGSISTSADYWLYSDGTVWNGIGTLGNTPQTSTGFDKISPNFNASIKTYVATAVQDQTVFNVPFTFTTSTIFVNGSIQLPTLNYTTSGSVITFTTELDLGDVVYIFGGTPNISTNDKLNRIFTSIATQGQTVLQIPYEFSTAIVYINGVLQNPTSAYMIGSDRIITFSEQLYENDEIIVMLGDIIVQSSDYVLKSELSLSTAADNIMTTANISIQQTINNINSRLGKSVNIMDYMSDQQLIDINLSSPTLDHSDAFNRAIVDSNFIILPAVPGWYNFGDIELPDIFRIDGNSVSTYTAASSTSVNGFGTVIKRTSSATCIFKFNRYVMFNNINIYGSGSAWMLKRNTSIDIQRIVFNDCGLYGSLYGIGLSSGYCKEVDAYNCHIANNINAGWRNTIDSKMIGGYINANTGSGVQLMTGANDNTFIGVKNEWNTGIAWEMYGSIANNIIGGITDRAGNSGLSLKNGSRCTVTGGVWRRNGKDILGNRACSHFYVEGVNNQLIVSGIDTRTGANDDGTGDVTPNYVLSTGGSDTSNSIIINGSSMGGFVSSGYSFSPTPVNVKIESNLFVEDYVNTGIYRKSNGLSYTGFSNAQVAPSTTVTYTMNAISMNDYSVFRRTISITARNTGSSSASAFLSSSFDVLLSKSTGNVNISVIPGTETNTGSNIGSTGTALLINPPVVSSDGLSISVDINNLSTATFSIQTYLQ